MARVNKTKRSARPYGEKQGPRYYNLVLDALRAGKTPKEAAAIAGVGRTTLFDWCNEDPEFKKAWAEAIEEGVDVLEQEAIRRAVRGVEKPVYWQGEVVGQVQEYSDSLLALLLRGRRAHVFRDRHEHVGDGGGPVKHDVQFEVIFVSAGKSDE